MIDRDEFLRKGYYVGNISEVISEPELFKLEVDKVKQINKSKFIYRQDSSRHQWYEAHAIKVPDATQQWYETDQFDRVFFKKHVVPFIAKLYPDTPQYFIDCTDSITLYENDDYTRMHRDGDYTQNPGRLCVILIYLSDEKDYNDGGGKLIIEADNGREEVLPVRGNFAIMDFTIHNLLHEVEVVKNNFNRYCYISFIKDRRYSK